MTEAAPTIAPESLQEELSPSALSREAAASRGFWAEAWRRFRRRKLAMAAVAFVLFLIAVALLAPAIVGTKPIIVRYKGSIYFPAMGYFNPEWENPIFMRDGFRKRYTPEKFAEKDPESWAIWPLVFQDPRRRVREAEWPDQPASETHAPPNRYNLFGTNQEGIDVFAQLVHGTTVEVALTTPSATVPATLTWSDAERAWLSEPQSESGAFSAQLAAEALVDVHGNEWRTRCGRRPLIERPPHADDTGS